MAQALKRRSRSRSRNQERLETQQAEISPSKDFQVLTLRGEARKVFVDALFEPTVTE